MRTVLGLALILLEMGLLVTGEWIHFGVFCGAGKQWNAFEVGVGGGEGYIDSLGVIFCNWFQDMSKSERCQFPQS